MIPLTRLLPFAQVTQEGDLDTRVQIVAVIVTVLMLGLVLELVRRRRLIERYALIWMFAALAMVVLAVWRGGLDSVGNLIGVADPVNGIFLIAFAVVFSLLLNFSVAISRLSEETKILAQTVSRLDAELRELRGEGPTANGSADLDEGKGEREGSAGEQPGQAPVEPESGAQ
jgi:hypothetical protein